MNQGYSICEHVFHHAEVIQACTALGAARVERGRAGLRHVLGVPAVRAVAHDERLMAIARDFVGPEPVPFRATLFEKSGKANWLVAWHQDTALPLRHRVATKGWGPWSVKAGLLYAHAPSWALEQVIALRLSLDDSTRSNGPLRVLPGTHLRGVLTDEEIHRLAREVAPVDCVAALGSVVAMRPLLIHASSKSANAKPRRVLHLEYAATVHLAPGIELARG